MAKFTHLDEKGQARMVDVGEKPATKRVARARGSVLLSPETYQAIVTGGVEKGDVLGVARIAGIMAAKRTDALIPLCHPLQLSCVRIDFQPDPEASAIHIESEVHCKGPTGVEMEALTAVSVAALTIYDMCKALDRAMQITQIELLYKDGGKSGTYVRQHATPPGTKADSGE